MIRTLMIFLLLTGASSTALAGWFGNDAPEDSLEYCTGLVLGGLESRQTAGPSRTALWLAWSYVIRSGALAQDTGSEAVNEGRAKFSDELDVATIQANLDQADGTCGLGRSNRQITGW